MYSWSIVIAVHIQNEKKDWKADVSRKDVLKGTHVPGNHSLAACLS